jgi:mitotic spindle assembly checkpoint protein MAD1
VCQLAAISEERDKLRKEHAMESDQSGMEKMIRELESTMHEQKELISHKDAELNMMNERLSLEARKAKSLEREGDQLRSQVALLESKVRIFEITP